MACFFHFQVFAQRLDVRPAHGVADETFLDELIGGNHDAVGQRRATKVGAREKRQRVSRGIDRARQLLRLRALRRHDAFRRHHFAYPRFAEPLAPAQLFDAIVGEFDRDLHVVALRLQLDRVVKRLRHRVEQNRRAAFPRGLEAPLVRLRPFHTSEFLESREKRLLDGELGLTAFALIEAVVGDAARVLKRVRNQKMEIGKNAAHGLTVTLALGPRLRRRSEGLRCAGPRAGSNRREKARRARSTTRPAPERSSSSARAAAAPNDAAAIATDSTERRKAASRT